MAKFFALQFDFKKKMALSLLLAVFFITIDRGLKILALNYYNEHGLELFNQWLYFVLAKNYQIAFSLPISGTFLNIVIIFIILSLLAILGMQIKKQGWPISALLLTLIMGAASNLYDRLKYGFVIDYLDLKYFTVFNLADVMIFFSIIFIISKKINVRKNI